MQHDPPPIPDHLRNTTPKHTDDEKPRPPFEAHEHVDEHRDAEEDEEHDICGEGGLVLVYAQGCGAE